MYDVVEYIHSGLNMDGDTLNSWGSYTQALPTSL